MNEPRTGAGRALVDGVSKASPGVGLMVRDNVAAAEAEAVATYRARLREKVEGLHGTWDPPRDNTDLVGRDAVLALIDEGSSR